MDEIAQDIGESKLDTSFRAVTISNVIGADGARMEDYSQETWAAYSD